MAPPSHLPSFPGRSAGRRDKNATIAYTDRSGRFHIISARKAARHEQDDCFSQAF
jgi:hypothetical protein